MRTLLLSFVIFALIITEAESGICPGFTEQCIGEQTCCLLKSGTYGCCPYANAVCCEDDFHCCPTATQCMSSGDCERTRNDIFKMMRLPMKLIRPLNK
uniref:Granulins domain-containing protein n=1 Tax=Plectus sambesii TaxID=2011161 RepID=A0A914VLX8_9BILA